MSIDAYGNFSLKNRMANSVDPDETARYKPSHLDLHCLHRYLFWSARLKEFCSYTFQWMSRRHGWDHGPKTITQIRQEAADVSIPSNLYFRNYLV